MSMIVNDKSPKIACIYDPMHCDPNQIAITEKLCNIDPLKNIVFFRENRFLEIESLNQYSVELLGKDKNISTSSSCMLLIEHKLLPIDPRVFRHMLSTIYTDPYLKLLFTGKYYRKYNPEKYGLEQGLWSKPFLQSNMTYLQQRSIENVEGLFNFLDRELPLQSQEERENFFEGHMEAITNAMTDPNGAFDINIFGAISEALAFLKIEEYHKKMGAQADISNELSLSMIHQLYGKGDSFDKLVHELNLKFRTQFQVSKVIKIVEKILKSENQDPNTIFVVRLGSSHREIMSSQLKQYFVNGDVKEITLSQEDLPQVEQKIQAQFGINSELVNGMAKITL